MIQPSTTRGPGGSHPMLLTVIIVLSIAAVFAAIGRNRLLERTATLGSMSDRWLADYRASHPS